LKLADEVSKEFPKEFGMEGSWQELIQVKGGILETAL
jgi:hypothetical protein